MSISNSMQIGLSGLSAQQTRLDFVSNNIANVQTTRTQAGGPYQRQDVVLAPMGSDTDPGGVRVSSILTDKTPGFMAYDPSHPDANTDGFVAYPNVDLAVEMTNMLTVNRAYEANLDIINTASEMSAETLNLRK